MDKRDTSPQQPTPRTDAAAIEASGHCEDGPDGEAIVGISFARQLERELAEVKEDLFQQIEARNRLSAPSASGERVDVELVRFLLGEAPLEGIWFGDSKELRGGKPTYWWRKRLRAMLGSPELVYDKATKSIAHSGAGAAMTEERAREILGKYIQEDGGIYSLGHYMAWTPGDDDACLDCRFSADELEAISFWMRRSLKNRNDKPFVCKHPGCLDEGGSCEEVDCPNWLGPKAKDRIGRNTTNAGQVSLSNQADVSAERSAEIAQRDDKPQQEKS